MRASAPHHLAPHLGSAGLIATYPHAEARPVARQGPWQGPGKRGKARGKAGALPRSLPRSLPRVAEPARSLPRVAEPAAYLVLLSRCLVRAARPAAHPPPASVPAVAHPAAPPRRMPEQVCCPVACDTVCAPAPSAGGDDASPCRVRGCRPSSCDESSTNCHELSGCNFFKEPFMIRPHTE